MSSQARIVAATVIAGGALIAALWMLVIGPKRAESAEVRDNVAAQEDRLIAAQSQLASYRRSQADYQRLLKQLRRLDRAVPGRGAISDMLRELQAGAKDRRSTLRLVQLKDPQPSTLGTTTARTPGATVGPGGLAALPFTFEYTGRYFALRDILERVRRNVRTSSRGLRIDGRLLTIDGLSFKPSEADARDTKAVISATAYIAPDVRQPRTPAAAPPASTTGGS